MVGGLPNLKQEIQVRFPKLLHPSEPYVITSVRVYIFKIISNPQSQSIMVKKILIGIGILILIAVLFFGYAMLFPASPAATATFSDQGLDISVSYSQPSKKGRLIFGEESEGALQAYGQYWRLGANAATEITFSKDVNFAGQPVPAGTYRMYAVPGADSFQISLNSEIGVFMGANEPDYSKDILKADLPVSIAPTETEVFTISFSSDATGINMDLVWDKTLVRVPIAVQ